MTLKFQSFALPLLIALLASSQPAFADCHSSIKLEGTANIDCCTPAEACIPAAQALYGYLDAIKDDPAAFTIALQASPWHLYDGELRILTVDELAEMIKPQLKEGAKRVLLIASWTGVAPEANGKSLARRLSEKLDGFPVSGMDGFLWVGKNGTTRTTRQAFTMKQRCAYAVHPGEEVMASLVAGWPLEYDDEFLEQGNADGVMRAGVGADVYMLCPDKALELYEAAAKLSSPIAAYNAAMIHLERGKEGDFKRAGILLSQAAALGDRKAAARLKGLSHDVQHFP